MEPEPVAPTPVRSRRGEADETAELPLPLSSRLPSRPERPHRYQVKESDQGRYLICLEAPEVEVRIERGLSVAAAAARKYPPGTIFLDGAAQAEPFLDLERRVYNLDRHEGCVRRFTLASCEQALVLVLRGLDLREHSWAILANDPDLDTLLAIWVLTNSLHLRDGSPVLRRAVIPLVRLEGVIDSHGLELKELCGFREEDLEEIHGRLETLRKPEAELKGGGEWGQADLLEYAANQLERIDDLVYPVGFFDSFEGVEELARDRLSDRKIVVVCRSERGIYEIEQELKRLYGKRLGVVVLEREPRVYTVRQVDTFLPVTLAEVYRKLNLLDPVVRGVGGGNRWGGSGEIGGSPRGTGSDLQPVEIAAACRLAYRQPTPLSRAGSVVLAVVLSGAAMLTGWLVEAWDGLPSPGSTSWQGGVLQMALPALVVAILCLVLLSQGRRHRLLGLRPPSGRSWLWAAPGAVLGGLLGGVWLVPSGVSSGFLGGLALLVLPLLAELTFRGVAQGVLARDFAVQHASGRWFLSVPVAVSTLLYVLWTLPLAHPVLGPAPPVWPEFSLAAAALGAVLVGASLGVARERAESLAAPLTLHYLALAVAWVVL